VTSFNKVILMGNLTRDPEMRYTPNGTAVTTMGLAVSRRYRQGDEQREDVCFVDVVVFGRQAETCSQYLTKGAGVIVDGRLTYRRWESDDGMKRSKLEVVAQDVRFMPRRDAAGGAAGPGEAAEAGERPRRAVAAESGAAGGGGEMAPPDFTDDDIPF
jgi:single-strand DNA-binding protein